MVQYTERDRLWNIALTKERIRAAELAKKFDVSERTARDCLETMHEMGWLKKEGGTGSEPVVYSVVINSEPKEEFIALE